LCSDRINRDIAEKIYGVITAGTGAVDVAATDARRDAIRRDRLSRAQPAKSPAARNDLAACDTTPALPFYPGVIQHGEFAVAEQSGALLAVAPSNWLDGCPILDTFLDDRAGELVARQHLDPLTGRVLYADVTLVEDKPSIEIRPLRWTATGESPQP
jgi:N-methylhydantoinase B